MTSALVLPSVHLPRTLLGRNKAAALFVLPPMSDDEDLVPVGRRRRATLDDDRRSPMDAREVDDYDEEDESDTDDDDDDDDDWMMEERNLFENVLVPNPLLDAMDPDGTADRFPELFSDGKFWRDMILLVLFLDFLSTVGPQSNPFPDLPWFYISEEVV